MRLCTKDRQWRVSRGLMFVLVVAVFCDAGVWHFPGPGMNWPVRPRLAMSQRLLPEDKEHATKQISHPNLKGWLLRFAG